MLLQRCLKLFPIQSFNCRQRFFKKRFGEEGEIIKARRKGAFLGYRSDIKEIIHLSDVVVNPALNEGLGLVILEAQALGKPLWPQKSEACLKL